MVVEIKMMEDGEGNFPILGYQNCRKIIETEFKTNKFISSKYFHLRDKLREFSNWHGVSGHNDVEYFGVKTPWNLIDDINFAIKNGDKQKALKMIRKVVPYIKFIDDKMFK